MKARYFFITALAAGIIFAWLIVSNQRQLVQLGTQLQAQDKAGQDVAAAKQKFTDYAKRHMGVRATVFLDTSYRKAIDAARAAATPAVNAQIYSQAQAACGGKSDSVSQSKCVSAYIASNSAPSANPQPMTMPDKQSYTVTAVGPNWNLSFAGVSLLLSLASFTMGCYLAALRFIK